MWTGCTSLSNTDILIKIKINLRVSPILTRNERHISKHFKALLSYTNLIFKQLSVVPNWTELEDTALSGTIKRKRDTGAGFQWSHHT